ncbi:hypothetical protein [Nocardia brasiliensis]|uniref:hypothetical protein n=1 Tax=Nocardia brasiliensis TaxID=37326 RepID=UPI0024590BDA|nr:hypothetical protein [Nocardia brasiliensis]
MSVDPHLHFVAITGTADSPKIEFTCRGDRDAECHSFPDRDCEVWTRGDHEHPFVLHEKCWMASFFDNAGWGAIDPMPEMLAESEITPGVAGPISTHFNGEYIEWEFVDGPVLA